MKKNQRSSSTPSLLLPAVLVMALVISLGLGGCQKATPSDGVTTDNLVRPGNPQTDKSIGDSAHRFSVIAQGAFDEKVMSGKILSGKSARARALLDGLASPEGDAIAAPEAAAPAPEALLVGFPLGLLGQQNVFGAVITAVSDKKSADMGRLKLMDLPPVHVQTLVSKTEDGGYVLALVGCLRFCTEGSEQQGLVAFPIVGVDQEKNEAIVDLSHVGAELDLMSILDPQGDYTQLKTKEAVTTALDY